MSLSDHEGHNLVMMVAADPKPGTPFGPYCDDCQEAFFLFRVMSDQDIADASRSFRERMAKDPEFAEYVRSLK